jgi:hypothetical protein
MPHFYPRRRAAEPSAPAHPPADTLVECPPHHWLVVGRAMTCRKCGLERTLDREGRAIVPAPPAALDDPAGEPGASSPTAALGVPDGSGR